MMKDSLFIFLRDFLFSNLMQEPGLWRELDSGAKGEGEPHEKILGSGNGTFFRLSELVFLRASETPREFMFSGLMMILTSWLS